MKIKPVYEVWVVAPMDEKGTPGMGPMRFEREFEGQKGESAAVDTLAEAMTLANGMRPKAYRVLVFERRVVRDLPGEMLPPDPPKQENGPRSFNG